MLRRLKMQILSILYACVPFDVCTWCMSNHSNVCLRGCLSVCHSVPRPTQWGSRSNLIKINQFPNLINQYVIWNGSVCFNYILFIDYEKTGQAKGISLSVSPSLFFSLFPSLSFLLECTDQRLDLRKWGIITEGKLIYPHPPHPPNLIFFFFTTFSSTLPKKSISPHPHPHNFILFFFPILVSVFPYFYLSPEHLTFVSAIFTSSHPSLIFFLLIFLFNISLFKKKIVILYCIGKKTIPIVSIG